ncbi:MAG TPA: hypothetical protein VEX41_02530 [Candidatus Eisenbacteria bacterium]|nr:hypothetical protein [Candidatus Eisenbacteria bacterium]
MKVLVGFLFATLVAVAISGQVGRSERTAEAQVQIDALNLHRGEHPGIGDGYDIRYRFDVDGTTYTGTTRRGWTIAGVERAKVCYDPADPRNHVLVLGRTSCLEPLPTGDIQQR